MRVYLLHKDKQAHLWLNIGRIEICKKRLAKTG